MHDWATFFDHLCQYWADHGPEMSAGLARLELQIALQRWLARYPTFTPAGNVSWTIGVRSPRAVPLCVRP